MTPPGPRTRRILTYLMLLIIVGAVGWMATRRATRQLRADLLLQANIEASMIGLGHVMVMSGTEADLASRDYQYIKRQLLKGRRANPRSRRLYLLGRTPDGRIFLFADSEPETSGEYAPPGQTYAEAAPLFDPASTPHTATIEGPVTDPWGTRMSLLVPIPHPTSDETLAVLGMDIAADDWNKLVAERAALPVTTTVIVIMLGLFVVLPRELYRQMKEHKVLLRDSLHTSSDLVRAIPVGLLICQHEEPDRLLLLDGNVAAERLMRQSIKDCRGREFGEFWPDARKAGIPEAALEVLKTGKAYQAEEVHYRIHDVDRVYRMRVFALPGKRLVFVFEDLTEAQVAGEQVRSLLADSNRARAALLGILEDQRRAEAALCRQSEFLQRLIDAMPYPVFYKDTQGRYLGCNRAFETFFGLAREAIRGKTLHDIAPRELPDAHTRSDEKLWTHPGTHIYEGVIQSADGITHEVIFHKATFEDLDGTIGGIIGAVLDITDRKKAEVAVREQLAELRRWHEAMLGRENRILELKREVNDLLAQMGHAARYETAGSTDRSEK